METARSFVIKLVYDLLSGGKSPCSAEESFLCQGRVDRGMLNEVVGEWLWIHK